jgi:hypothetical protein
MRQATYFLLCVVQLSCFGGGANNVVVSDIPFRLNPVPTDFECYPPLVRTHRSASLRVELSCAWHPEPPWDHIVVDGLGNVVITATLVSSSGAQFKHAILGMAGGNLDIRFEPEIPKDESIVLVRLESSHELDVSQINWYNFNPL